MHFAVAFWFTTAFLNLLSKLNDFMTEKRTSLISVKLSMLVIKAFWSHLGWKEKSLAANVINSQTPPNPARFKPRRYHIQSFRRNLNLSNTQNTS